MGELPIGNAGRIRPPDAVLRPDARAVGVQPRPVPDDRPGEPVLAVPDLHATPVQPAPDTPADRVQPRADPVVLVGGLPLIRMDL